MEAYDKAKAKLYEDLEKYIIRDEETDEITDLDPSAPDDVKKAYEEMMAEQNSTEPIVK